MIDQELVEYIRQNEQKYGIQKIRDGLLAQGVPEGEIDEAIEYVREEERSADVVHDSEEEMFFARSVHTPKKDLADLFEGDRKNIESASSFVRKLSLDVLDLEKTRPYRKKAEGLLLALLGFAGVDGEKRDFAASLMLQGAISFFILTVVVIFTQYVVGQMIFPEVAQTQGVLARLDIPDVFIIDLHLGSLLFSLFSSFVWGGILTFLFARYAIHYVPLTYFPGVLYRLTAFYFSVHFISGIFWDGLLTDRAGVYMKGYFFIAIGLLIASYISSLYFTGTLENRYPGRLKTLLYERW